MDERMKNIFREGNCLSEEQIKKYIAWQGQKDLPQEASLGF
jgi:hypothetical protein